LLDRVARAEDEDLSLTMSAAIVDLSPFYLSRLFKGTTGVSFRQYVIQARVKRCVRLVESGQTRLADAALACGFYDQSHLTKCFTLHMGVTPGGYAAAARERRTRGCIAFDRERDGGALGVG